MPGQVYTGTSGFAYTSWKPDFYPAKLPSSKFLEHYAGRLNSTEINYTFRRLPSARTLEQWVAATPDGFVFSLKAHMRLTHILKLKNCAEFLDVFLRAIDPLRSSRRLGSILFQLPPAAKPDPAALDEFAGMLPRDVRSAFEFRNTGWHEAVIYDILSRHDVALCLAESEKLVTPEVSTAGFDYFRLRKPEYSDSDLDEIAAKISAIANAGRDVFVYFKHEETAAGALYAERVLAALRT